MSLYNDRMRCRQNADGSWTVRVTRRFAAGFLGLRYRDETRTYTCEKPPQTAREAWDEAMRRARRPSRRDLARRRALIEGSSRCLRDLRR